METSDLGVSTLQQSVMDRSSTDGISVKTFSPTRSLPDFELSELWLCPRFSTVDLGEVKSVCLKVDVHGVHKQQTHRSALLRDCKNGGKKNAAFSFVCPEFYR